MRTSSRACVGPQVRIGRAYELSKAFDRVEGAAIVLAASQTDSSLIGALDTDLFRQPSTGGIHDENANPRTWRGPSGHYRYVVPPEGRDGSPVIGKTAHRRQPEWKLGQRAGV